MKNKLKIAIIGYGQWIEPYSGVDSIYSLDKIVDAASVDFFRNDKLKD